MINCVHHNGAGNPRRKEAIKMAKGKEYPGQLDEYARLREEREAMTVTDDTSAIIKSCLEVAEQLAGLSYIADGIRYNTRKAKS